MYFPYLRGKQFDLIAIRELSEQISKSGVIHPIIEPVRESSSTLRITVEELIDSNVPFTLIINPEVGDLDSDHQLLANVINAQANGYENFNIGVLLNTNTDLNHINDLLGEVEDQYKKLLIHKSRFHDFDQLQGFLQGKEIAYNLFNSSVPIRRYRRLIDNSTKVILSDPFNAQRVNADYVNNTDEFFTDEHNFYDEDGFAGFADYTTIGDDYSDSGFAPYAVAIHLTYLRDNNQIWIKHFVSDSNEDYTDVAGKYSQALVKLIRFINANDILESQACREFREHYQTGHYPGLGSVKKLSIMHHIELIISQLS
jgi:hypothetical protein